MFMNKTSSLFFCYTVMYSFNCKRVIYLMLYFLWTLLSYCLEFLVVAFVIFILLFLSAIFVTVQQLFSLFSFFGFYIFGRQVASNLKGKVM